MLADCCENVNLFINTIKYIAQVFSLHPLDDLASLGGMLLSMGGGLLVSDSLSMVMRISLSLQGAKVFKYSPTCHYILLDDLVQ